MEGAFALIAVVSAGIGYALRGVLDPALGRLAVAVGAAAFGLGDFSASTGRPLGDQAPSPKQARVRKRVFAVLRAG